MSLRHPGRPFTPRLQHRARVSGGDAFALIELLIVVAIILFLFTLYFKGFSGASEDKQRAACQKNLEQIYVALKTFAADNNDRYPMIARAQASEAPLSLLVPRYTSVTEIFICPASGDRKLPEAVSFERRKISYAYCMGRTTSDGADQLLMSDSQINTQPKAAGQLVFSPDGKGPGRNHGSSGGNLLYGDGQVKPAPAKTEVPIPIPAGVVLLNPRPS